MTKRDGELTPIPATREAVREFDPGGRGVDLLEELRTYGDRVRELVPDCVGVSLGYLEADVMLTLVASAKDFAVLDAVQYLAGGPCAEAPLADRVLAFDQVDPLSEQEWALFARATAARGIRSTLTLPVLADGAVVGSVNLYAASSRAFDGLHEELAAIFGAWAPSAVSNADLAFSTRLEAEKAPQRLRDDRTVQTAIGILAAARQVTIAEAEEHLREAAARAGVGMVELARIVVETVDTHGPD